MKMNWCGLATRGFGLPTVRRAPTAPLPFQIIRDSFDSLFVRGAGRRTEIGFGAGRSLAASTVVQGTDVAQGCSGVDNSEALLVCAVRDDSVSTA